MRFRYRRVMRPRAQVLLFLVSIIPATVTTNGFTAWLLVVAGTGLGFVAAVLGVEHFFPGLLLVPRRTAAEKSPSGVVPEHWRTRARVTDRAAKRASEL